MSSTIESNRSSRNPRWSVVDASVWVSLFFREDVHHRASEQWLYRQLNGGNRIVEPTLLLVEVAGAIARRAGNSAPAKQAVDVLGRLPGVRWLALTTPVRDHAAALAAERRLRGADAVYVALAHRLRIPLVSWDDEQLSRTELLVDARTP